ncbi:hypothetical protein EV182_003805 [Spiromyces aspiralis]|uniref:Uncharacterized protein n=1 Tax=Spiromyces aspiralis TaxID=68401 RepID=A0ACC1HDB4_9FUNG|nr:hypothetical protein EV182_003805 [Spiromyces aspiralis]
MSCGDKKPEQASRPPPKAEKEKKEPDPAPKCEKGERKSLPSAFHLPKFPLMPRMPPMPKLPPFPKPFQFPPHPFMHPPTPFSDDFGDFMCGFGSVVVPTNVDFHFPPRVDVIDESVCVFVYIDAPGVSKDSLAVKVEGSYLMVSGRYSNPHESKHATWYIRERPCGKFCLPVLMPCPVDKDKIEVKCLDGVVQVKLGKPKKAGSQ